jgi:hypothetical protein
VSEDDLLATMAETHAIAQGAILEWEECPVVNTEEIFYPNGYGGTCISMKTPRYDPRQVVGSAEEVLSAQRLEMNENLLGMTAGKTWWDINFGPTVKPSSELYIPVRDRRRKPLTTSGWYREMRENLKPDQNERRVRRVLVHHTPVARELVAALTRLGILAGELVSGTRPQRGSYMEGLLRWWLQDPSATRTHRQVIIEYERLRGASKERIAKWEAGGAIPRTAQTRSTVSSCATAASSARSAVSRDGCSRTQRESW